jgi:hypothetical protein
VAIKTSPPSILIAFGYFAMPAEVNSGILGVCWSHIQQILFKLPIKKHDIRIKVLLPFKSILYMKNIDNRCIGSNQQCRV